MLRSGRAAFLLLAAVESGASGFATERRPGPPEAASEAIRVQVAAEGLRVAGPGVQATFWFRTSPLPADPAGHEDSALRADRSRWSRVAPGALVGVALFGEPWLDYRDRRIEPGWYTMRYLLQPSMKEHRGTTMYRDFLVLTPIDRDREPIVDPADLVRASAAAASAGHPLVMALFPVTAEGSLPAIAVNGLGQPMLGVRVGSETAGIVLAGHGRISDP
jgi:hypothetical protein